MENIYIKALDAYIRREGLTQAGFGKLIDSSQTIVWQWLSGTRFPSKTSARRIEQATGSAVPFGLWKAAKMDMLDA